MKKRANNSLLCEWQKRLGLQDWTIEVCDNCKPEDVALQNVCGVSQYTETAKTAVIQILVPEYYGDRIRPYDYEKTLVHELLHIKLCLLSANTDDYDGNLYERYLHQIIDDLARALVDAKRYGGKNDKV